MTYKKRISFLVGLVTIATAIVISFIFSSLGQAATYTWDGGGGDENWSTAANWSSDTVPGSSDVAVFNGTSVKNVTMDAAVNVLGIDVNVGYTGILTQANTITIGEGDWDHNTATFVGATQAITISGELDLNGGSWTSTSGTFILKEDLRSNGAVTFNHNNGLIIFVPDGSTEYIGSNSMTFYDVEVNPIGATDGIRTPTATSTYTIENSLTLTNGEIDSSSNTAWILEGTLSVGAGFDGGTGNIDLQADIDIVGVNGTVYPGFTFTDPLSSYTGPGVGNTVTFEGALNVSFGTVSLGDGVTNMAGWTDTGTGTGAFGSGEIVIVANGTWDVDSSASVNDFTINGGSLTVATGDLLIVTGDTTLTNGAIFNGVLRSTGTISNIGSSFDGGGGTWEVACACTFSNASNQMSGMLLNNAGAAYTNTHVTSTQFEGDVTLTLGTFNAGSAITVLYGDLTVADAATFNHDSGTLQLIEANFNLPDTHSIDGDITFNDIFFNIDYSVTAEFTAGDTITVLGDLTIDPTSRTGARGYMTSSIPGTPVTVNFSTSSTVEEMGFTDINNGGAGTVTCIQLCIDGGGNSSSGFDLARVGVDLGAVSSFTTTEAGGTSTVTVRLDRKPTADVVITPTSGDTDEVVATPSSITLTSANYFTDQTFTFTGQDDVLDDGEQSVAVTFSATSGDAAYNGLSLPSRSVTNIDDDTTEDSIDFDDVAKFTAQDVKDTGAAAITWFQHDWQGSGNLMTANGGSNVNISTSDIQSGCTVDIGGADYQVVGIIYDTTGYIRLTQLPPIPGIPDLDEIAPQGTVNSITCTGATDDSDAGSLTKGWVNARKVDGGASSFSGGLHYDSLNDVIWSRHSSSGSPTAMNQSTLATIGTSSTFPKRGTAYDPTRGFFWIPQGGSVIVIDGSTGGYAFGTLGASTFTSTAGGSAAVYDATQDAIWITGGSTSGDVHKLNASNGANISITEMSSLSISGNSAMTGIAHDVATNTILVANDEDQKVVKINALDGTAFDTNVLTSSYDVEGIPGTDFIRDTTGLGNQTFGEFYYVHTGCDYDQVGDTAGDRLAIVDFDDGSTVGHFELSSCIYQLAMDEVNDILYVIGELTGAIHKIDLDTREIELFYSPVPEASDMTVDSDGDVWIGDEYDSHLWEMVVDGVPQSKYYTVTSKDTSQIDVSADGGLSGVTVNETLDSGFIYYALSFDDRASFVTWNSPARVIASSSDADHGGVDGNWYYRDNASTWTATPSNTAEESISLAVAAGANNQMTGTELAALDSTNLEDTDGFDAGVTTTLDVAATFYTTDAHNSPTVEGLTFDLAASAAASTSSTAIVSTTGEGIEMMACYADNFIEVTLTGNDIDDYILSEDSLLAGSTWETFVDDGTGINQSMDALFVLSAGDGDKTVYAKFRSNTGNQSNLISLDTVLDVAGGCDEVEVPDSDDSSDTSDTSTGSDSGTGSTDSGTGTSGGSFGSFADLNFVDCLGNARTILAEERNTYMFGVARVGKSTPNGFPSQISQVDPGDYLRSESFDTVYCVTEGLERRPFVGETDYFTHTRSFLQTRWVTDETMAALPLVGPMLPKIGTSLLKFESTNNVYLHDENLEDSTKGLLYWITTEELAKVMIGSTWADFVIDVSPALFPRFDFGDPLITSREVDTSDLRERELLNEEAASAEALDEDVRTAGFLKRFRSIIPRK